mgnify:CR=1 FL=1
MKVRVRDFSKTPGARYRTDGDYSGQEFYEDVLQGAFVESIRRHEKLEVDLDGTEGYATSFLDESFGRLSEEFGAQTVLNNVIIISFEEPDWIEEIQNYIHERHEVK